MAWIDEEHGWVAAPEDIMNALSSEGFEECKARDDHEPAGQAAGVRQRINPRTGSVAQ